MATLAFYQPNDEAIQTVIPFYYEYPGKNHVQHYELWNTRGDDSASTVRGITLGLVQVEASDAGGQELVAENWVNFSLDNVSWSAGSIYISSIAANAKQDIYIKIVVPESPEPTTNGEVVANFAVSTGYVQGEDLQGAFLFGTSLFGSRIFADSMTGTAKEMFKALNGAALYAYIITLAQKQEYEDAGIIFEED